MSNLKEEIECLYIQEPPLNILCRLGIHRWSLWTEILERSIGIKDGLFSYKQLFQRRACIKCRAGQERIVR